MPYDRFVQITLELHDVPLGQLELLDELDGFLAAQIT